VEKEKKHFSLHFYLPISSFLCREREKECNQDRAPRRRYGTHEKTHSRVRIIVIVPTRSFSSYSDGS
jgi:hypothetical protein